MEMLDESGRAGGTVLDVEDTTFALGRDAAQCSIVLPHEDIAAVHARIDVDPENPVWRVFVRPECSPPAVAAHTHAPMTILNGFPLWRTQPLHRGDVLSLGPFDLALADAGVVLHTGERLSFCAASTRDVAAVWPPRDAKVRAEGRWAAETLLHRPHTAP